MKRNGKDTQQTWRPPTRRAFVAMLGAAAAAIALRERPVTTDPPRPGWSEPANAGERGTTRNGHTRWIGHC